MKQIFTICLIFLCSTRLYAQDVITLKNGAEIQAKIVDTSGNSVKYKLFKDQDGQTYSVKKSEISMYTIQQGERPHSVPETSADVANSPTSGELPNALKAGINGTTPVQLTSYMKYKQLRTIYDFRRYEPTLADRHNPTLAGVASFFIPGLGQIICGETGRGFALFGAHIGGVVLASAASAYAYDYESAGASLLSVAMGIGLAAFDIYSIIDGVRVAKVLNMYEQDWREQQKSIDITLQPSIYNIKYNNSIKPAAGLTLSMTF